MEVRIGLIYLVFFLVALVFSLILNFLLLKLSQTLGIRNTSIKTSVRWSAQEKPSLGGISFYVMFLLTIVVYAFFNHHSADFFNLQIMGLFVAVTTGFLLGLFDDAYNTHPRIKFLTQIICALILILTGTYIEFFNNVIFNYLLTIFWVVGIMNSINMLDNMDGITTIVSASILAAIMAGLILSGDFANPLLIIIIGSAAALLGFLYFNWSPAKMFMGDTGSQFLGILLAAIGIIYFWNGTDVNGNHILSMKVVSVITAFSLPIIDTTTVFIKRIAKRSSPFIGGKDHTTHHLSYIGFSDKQVALIFAVVSALSVGNTIIIKNYINNWSHLHSFLFGLYFILIFAVLFIIAIKKPPINVK